MPRILIVSPHFPPVNAPDMQRVRTSLPHFREFGWEPHVLAAAPSAGDATDPLLLQTVPDDVAVERVRSVPPGISRRVGIGNVALRAMPFLYSAGRRLIEAGRIDLVYFSTTMFLSMPLGRLWKRRFGTPYVIDMQDPWVTDYYDTHPAAAPPRKYAVARRLHAVLEPWTMAEVDGIVSVSPLYVEELRRRYPRLAKAPCAVVPFGVSTGDWQFVQRHPQSNRVFRRGDGLWHGVFTGAVGDYMAPALGLLFGALRHGLKTAPALFERVRLHFVGTDYAHGRTARRTVTALAATSGVDRLIDEQPDRAPYFEALQIVSDADGLLLLGSDDPAYNASKLQLYLFSGKPIVAAVHDASVMRPWLEQGRTILATFGRDSGDGDAVVTLANAWHALLAGPREAAGDAVAGVETYSAREATRQQCAVFDAVLANRVSSATAA